MKIELTNVYVHSPKDAFEFYTETLGLVSKMYVPEADLAIVASPTAPDGTGLLLEPNGSPIAKTYQEALWEAGLPAIVFSVEDLQAEFERLKGLGVVFRKEPTKTDYGIESIFEDTCGNLIQLIQLS